MTTEQTELAVIVTLLMLLIIPVIVVAAAEIVVRIARKRRRARPIILVISPPVLGICGDSLQEVRDRLARIKVITVEASAPQAVATITITRASCDHGLLAEGDKP